jgi:cation transport ATPase
VRNAFGFHPNATPSTFSLAMKMEDPSKFESFEDQERRGRREFRGKAVIYSAIIAGLIVWIVPAGPWISQEAFFTAFGRSVVGNATADFVLHMGLSLFYGWLTALCIYRAKLGVSLLGGVGVGCALYVLNYIVFVAIARLQSNELHVVLAHFLFGLFFAVCYRAWAVPRRQRVA